MASGLSEQIDYMVDCELAKRSFWEFCLFYDRPFFEKRAFLKQIADAFQRIHDRKIKRLAISMPPRAGKSRITSLFCAWTLGHKPDESVMRNCCTATLYKKLSRDTRNIMISQAFHDVFPEVKMSDDNAAVDGWSTTKAVQVSYFGGGVGGTVIGFGASALAITDDLIRSFKDAMSTTMLETVHEWYDGTHTSRQEKNCPVIDIGTRWSKKDTIGRQEAAGFYDEVIKVAALNEAGESFCEDVKSTEEYQDLKERTAPEIWNAEYQQEPIEATGTLFPLSQLKRFKMEDLKMFEGKEPMYEGILGYIDIADKGTDRTCFPTGVVFPDRVYITDVIFTPLGMEESVPMCAGVINRLKHDYVRAETNNQGGEFRKDLQALLPKGLRRRILKVRSVKNKHSRILMQYGFIKQNFYFRSDIERNSHYDQYITELTSYTKAGSTTEDDAADGTAGLSKFVKSIFRKLFGITDEDQKEEEDLEDATQ